MLELKYAKFPERIRNPKFVTYIKAYCTIVETAAEVANSFSDNNGRGTLPMARRDDWHNLIAANDPAALAAAKFAASYGLNAEAPPGKRGWRYLPNGKIIDRMLNGAKNGFSFSNAEILGRALSLITNKECVGLYGKKDATTAKFIGGLCVFVALTEKRGFTHAAGIMYMLQRPDVLDRVREIVTRLSKEDIAKTLKPYSGDSAVPEGEEATRYNTRAAALIRIYNEYVPQPKKKNGIWRECPSELRTLMHEAPAIRDELDRHNFIASQHATLDKRKKLPKATWLFKYKRGLTR
jgi:hypothetical protein